MKKAVSFMLALLLFLGLGLSAASATLSQTQPLAKWGYSGSYLDPSNVGPVTPTIYSTRRYRDIGKDKAYDLNGDFSSSMIRRQQGNREYGLYLKFTPGRTDDDYYIWRFDTIVTDPWGDQVFYEGFDSDMTCKFGYYWYWEFYNLNSMFEDLIYQYGNVPKGTYTMDIYFNEKWAGKTQFRVKD